jgi:hypothetical protein
VGGSLDNTRFVADGKERDGETMEFDLNEVLSNSQ